VQRVQVPRFHRAQRHAITTKHADYFGTKSSAPLRHFDVDQIALGIQLLDVNP
jgi:hypothetical protein